MPRALRQMLEHALGGRKRDEAFAVFVNVKASMPVSRVFVCVREEDKLEVNVVRTGSFVSHKSVEVMGTVWHGRNSIICVSMSQEVRCLPFSSVSTQCGMCVCLY